MKADSSDLFRGRRTSLRNSRQRKYLAKGILVAHLHSVVIPLSTFCTLLWPCGVASAGEGSSGLFRNGFTLRRIPHPSERANHCSAPLAGHRLLSAFTLIELLVATAVFMLLVLVLASVSNQALSVWSRSENKSELREAGRAAANLIGSELRQAVLPVDRADQSSLQFVVNPASVATPFKNADCIFWQAPIATSRAKGDLAVVGYFVRKEASGVGKLCRLFVNPDDPDNQYKIYSDPQSWVSAAVLDSKALASEASNLQGLFLENVAGFWITAYSDAVTPFPADYDSRVTQTLPARVEISLALLDKIGAQRVTDGSIRLPTSPVSSFSNAVDFQNAVEPALRSHLEAVTINVPF